MQINVQTDNQIEGGEALTQRITSEVEGTLGRFSDWITRVEVHISDENSSMKTGKDDIRCVVEARPKGLPPVSASNNAPTPVLACEGAVEKMEKILNRTAGRMRDSQ
ncbi:MAG: HPF/RaiA family ribosome-associated protein [Bacteroidetes bacterium]|nr:HPF/RaiA family ribosome-associated protein [Bacteroidota bacterium]